MYKVWVNRLPVICIGKTLLPAAVDEPDVVSAVELEQIIKQEKGKREVSFSKVNLQI